MPTNKQQVRPTIWAGFRVDPELHRQMKVRLAAERRSLQELLETAVRDYVAAVPVTELAQQGE